MSPNPTPPPDPMRLPDEVQALLLAQARFKPLAAGEPLFPKGALPDALYGVVSGSLRVSMAAPNGRAAVVAAMERGHWFGEVSLLIGKQRSYDTMAIEPCEIAIVNAAEFHALIASRPDVLLAFTRLVCHRLRQASMWIDDAILMPLSGRLAKRILTLEARASEVGATLTVSQEELAMMLGVSRQSVNRQLRQWEADGVVRLHYGRIEVIDSGALSRLAA
jgi:CRP/FNR family cyclic AMP-dependent transcriptional regulator